MSAATDWANKRKAQMLRAEQIKAQRKAGLSIDDPEPHNVKPMLAGRPKYLEEQHSFQPQLTKKAGYAYEQQRDSTSQGLGRGTNSGSGQRGIQQTGDSLDDLTDNIFEKALPGARGAQQTKAMMNGASLQGKGGAPYGAYPQQRDPLSPGSDTLGREIRRHHSEDYDNDDGHVGQRSQYGQERDRGHYSQKEDAYDGRAKGSTVATALVGEGGYKSKFMQQYAAPAASSTGTIASRKQQQPYDEPDTTYATSNSSRRAANSGYYEEDDEAPTTTASKRASSSNAQPSSKNNSSVPTERKKATEQSGRHERTAADVAAEDEFLSSLRGGDNANGGSKRAAVSKPGWNDDVSQGSNLFGEPPPLRGGKKVAPKVSSKVDTRREPSKDMAAIDRERERERDREKDVRRGAGQQAASRNAVRSTGVINNVGDDMPLPTQVNKGSPHPGFGSEYPDEYPTNRNAIPTNRGSVGGATKGAVNRNTQKDNYRNTMNDRGGYQQETSYEEDAYDEPPARANYASNGYSSNPSGKDRSRGHDRNDSGPADTYDSYPQQVASPRTQQSRHANSGEPVTHARSRLSLLKNKIRLSESSNGTRGSNGDMGHDSGRSLQRSNSDYDLDVDGYGKGEYMISPREQRQQMQPKTAPSRHRQVLKTETYDDEDDSERGAYDQQSRHSSASVRQNSEYGSSRLPSKNMQNTRPKDGNVGAAKSKPPKFRTPDNYEDEEYAEPYQPYEEPPAADAYGAKGKQGKNMARPGMGGGGIGAGTGVFNADIYSAAADMPGAYPEGMSAPESVPYNNSRVRNDSNARPQHQAQPPSKPKPLQQSQYQQPPPRSQAKPAVSMPSEYPDEYDDGGGDIGGPQMECPDCGRKFNEGPYQKHIKICAKVFQQKRKAFDSKKMRIMAIAEQAPEVLKLAKLSSKEQAKHDRQEKANANKRGQEAPVKSGESGKSKWAEQSRQFREAMKASRAVTQAIATGGPLPEYRPSAPDPSLIQCPHCHRNFNQKAADRHIPQCQNIKAQPKSLKAGSGHGAVSRAVTNKTAKRGVQF